MGKHIVERDVAIARQAAAILGTTSLDDTIHASLVEVLNVKRRVEFVSLLSQSGRFDLAADDSWGGE